MQPIMAIVLSCRIPDLMTLLASLGNVISLWAAVYFVKRARDTPSHNYRLLNSNHLPGPSSLAKEELIT
jgi:hypothetical protein